MDCDGVGGPIADRVRQLIGTRNGRNIVVDVNSGRRATEEHKYFNKRAEMWGRAKDAIGARLDLPNDGQLKDHLISPEYGFDNKNRIKLEKKEDMKKRGLSSPNDGDALAYTFAENVILEAEDTEEDNINPYPSPTGWQGA